MDSDCDKLIKWLNTFDLQKPVYSVSDLNNGDVFCKILTELSPDYFKADWSARIKKDVTSDWRIKASNLKKILKGLLEYYQKKLSISISESHIPDVNAIAEEEDPSETSKLLQLLLGCAVSCSNKEVHVEKIMGLEEELQHFVMLAIKEIMSSSDSSNSDSDISTNAILDSEVYKKLLEEKEEVVHKCARIEKKMAFMTEEKSALKCENDQLSQQLNHVNVLDDPHTPMGRRVQQAHKQLEHCQEELFKAETIRDDLKLRCEGLQEENAQLRFKVESFGELTKESRDLSDELDILRHNADKNIKYESTINSLKRKIESSGDMEGQMKYMEERNKTFIERNLELEEEVSKLGQMKLALEAYKKEVVELQVKSSEQDKAFDKAIFDSKRCRNKLEGLVKDKERLVEENMNLKEMNEELTVLQSSQSAANVIQNNDNNPSHFMNVTPEIREELLKLQHENKLLKGRVAKGGGEVGVDGLQSLLGDSGRAKEELEMKLRLQNRTILELEAKIEDLSEESHHCRSQNSTTLQQNSTTLQQNSTTLQQNSSSQQNVFSSTQQEQLQRSTVHQQPATLQQLNSSNHSQQPSTFSNSFELKSHQKTAPELTEEVERLRLVLRGKEDQIRLMEKKYQNYLDKAKYIMQQERPQPPHPPPNIISLQDQIIEKDNFIKALQSTIKIYETEQKMMMSAYYNLSIKSHKRNLEAKLSKDHLSKLPLQPPQQSNNHTQQSNDNPLPFNNNPHQLNHSQFLNNPQPLKITPQSKIPQTAYHIPPPNLHQAQSNHTKTHSKTRVRVASVTPTSSSSSVKMEDK